MPEEREVLPERAAVPPVERAALPAERTVLPVERAPLPTERAEAALETAVAREPELRATEEVLRAPVPATLEERVAAAEEEGEVDLTDDEPRTARLRETPEERAAPPRALKPEFLTPGR